MTEWYHTDVDDPEAPVELLVYKGMRAGDFVVYENPAWRREDGTYATGGMDGTLVVSALFRFPADVAGGDYVEAILNEGEWQVNADNLRRI